MTLPELATLCLARTPTAMRAQWTGNNIAVIVEFAGDQFSCEALVVSFSDQQELEAAYQVADGIIEQLSDPIACLGLATKAAP